MQLNLSWVPSAEETSMGLAFGEPMKLLQDRWLAFVEYSPRIAIALVLVLVSWWVSHLVVRWDRPFKALSNNPFAASLLRKSIRLAVFVVGLFLALDVLQATALAGAMLGTAGVAGLAVGFAFKDLIENYIAGILLSLRQPFSPRDLVDIDGHQGKVMRLTSRATILITLDGNHLRLPNSLVFKAVITNFTRAPKRRFDFSIGVGVNEDLVAARKLGLSILGKMKGVIADPEPTSELVELGDSNVSMRFYGWVDQREHSFTRVRSEAVRRVKTAFDEAEIEMPEPIYRVLLTNRPESEPERSKPAPTSSAAQELDQELTADNDPIDRQIDDEQNDPSHEDLLSQQAPLE